MLLTCRLGVKAGAGNVLETVCVSVCVCVCVFVCAQRERKREKVTMRETPQKLASPSEETP